MRLVLKPLQMGSKHKNLADRDIVWEGDVKVEVLGDIYTPEGVIEWAQLTIDDIVEEEEDVKTS